MIVFFILKYAIFKINKRKLLNIKLKSQNRYLNSPLNVHDVQ